MTRDEFKTAYSLARALDKATKRNPYETPQRKAFYKSIRANYPVWYAVVNKTMRNVTPVIQCHKAAARMIMNLNTKYY